MADDALFSSIAQMHGGAAWGNVLDAGTGDYSLRWVLGLPTESWTAVTADRTRYDGLMRRFAKRCRSQDRIVLGNWTNPDFLGDEVFDVVLADYLVGAIDVFSPYFQYEVIDRLAPHVRQALYLIGLQPFPDSGASLQEDLVCQLVKTRDACHLLGGQRVYREYPHTWMEGTLARAGFRVAAQEHFPIIINEGFVTKQVRWAKKGTAKMENLAARRVLNDALDQLADRLCGLIAVRGTFTFGFDYVIKAVPVANGPTSIITMV